MQPKQIKTIIEGATAEQRERAERYLNRESPGRPQDREDEALARAIKAIQEDRPLEREFMNG